MSENGVSHELDTNEPRTIRIEEYNHVGDMSDHSDHSELSGAEDSQDESFNGHHLGLKIGNNMKDMDFSLPLKQVLFAFNRVINHRLDSIENHLDSLDQYCHILEEKVDTLAATVRDHNMELGGKRSGQTVIVGVPQGSPGSSPNSANTPFTTTIGPNVTLITLNTEADYPCGSWLGDESNPEMRVRCHISPTDLFHINTTCHTPEKMALTLLDYLFDRETQACSNISGTGKHKKKQLDPLLIYGVRCHLILKFGITEKEWHRIKQNMDSKCRTAFRRKMKGLSLSAFREKADAGLNILNDTLGSGIAQVPDSESELSMDQTSQAEAVDLETAQAIALQQSVGVVDQADLTAVMQNAQVIHTTEGDIQVLHATPEQIARIQQTHQIQILTGAHVITTAGDQLIQEVEEGVHMVQEEEEATLQAVEIINQE